jgi:hypothetical protein
MVFFNKKMTYNINLIIQVLQITSFIILDSDTMSQALTNIEAINDVSPLEDNNMKNTTNSNNRLKTVFTVCIVTIVGFIIYK